MCEFCPIGGGQCGVCREPEPNLFGPVSPEPLPKEDLAAVTGVVTGVLLGKAKDGDNQTCGGGRRVIRKRVVG